MNYEIMNFDREVIERSRTMPVLVDFWAQWCAPCKLLGPLLERLAQKHRGSWVLAKVNIDAHPEVAMQYGVKSIPNVKMFINGVVVSEFSGALPEQSVEQWLKAAVPGKNDMKVNEAAALIHQNEPELAEAVLNEVLAEEPQHKTARVLLAQLIVFTEPSRAVELVEPFSEGDREFEIADAIRSFGTLFIKAETPEILPDSDAKEHCLAAVDALRNNDFDTALEEFILALRKDRLFNGECARKACIAVFRYLGEGHELTRKYRRAFGAAL
jgi:putative thioredoxin